MSRSPNLPTVSALDAWLAEQGWQGHDDEALAGDVGHRRYHVLTRDGDAGREQVVLAVYPAALRASCRNFVTTTELLARGGVRVPRVLAAHCELGAMLVEFLGASTLNDWAEEREWDEITPRFEAALEAARHIAELDPDEVTPLSPPLNADLLTRELRLFAASFLEPHGLLEGDLGRRVEVTLEALADSIAEVPPRPCHRDFMVRNLVPWDGGVAILDHQDLRLGPPLYDLASLLNDSLFPPPELERRLVEAWCAEEGAECGGGNATGHRDGGGRNGGGQDRWLEYHRVAAQRTLKAVGSYAMAEADGKTFHRHRIAPTFERGLAHLSHVPEAAATAASLFRRWRELGSGAMLES